MTLVWRPGWNGLTEPEAVEYVAAVEAADGQDLEFGVAKAINDFVLGCKNDGIWPAIKASCILAGARTLDGALVPLVGAAPTNFNFVDGDYDRETGLMGNGSTKYLDSNRANNADPQNSNHNCCYAEVIGSNPFIGAGTTGTGSNVLAGNVLRNRSSTAQSISSPGSGFIGISRSSSSVFVYRADAASNTYSIGSQSPSSDKVFVFARSSGTTPSAHSGHRIAFYSIGESLDLAALDGRVTDLITNIGAAIP